MGAADRRPARPHRPELGQGLDHRGQRHPRRQVLGHLASARRPRPATTTRPCAATSPATSTSSSRCSPPARSAGTGSTSARTSSARNTIYDCGQNGIVGHLGCVFSTIEDNHIYNIALKREFYGYEIAGIKLHAAIDVDHPPQPHPRLLARHLAGLADPGHPGLAQPLLRQQPRPVRRGQPRPLPRRPQHLRLPGLAGAVQPGRRVRQQPRLRHRLRSSRSSTAPTPYHVPHSTQVAGYAAIYGGDDRHIGNIFLGGDAAQAYGPTARAGQRRRLRHRRLRRPPAVDGGLPRPRRRPHPRRPRALHRREAARLHPRQRLRRGAEPFEAEEGALVLNDERGLRSRRRRRRPRSTWRLSCPTRSTTRQPASSAGRTCRRSASSTPTSRNPTEPRPPSTPTWSASGRTTARPTQPDRSVPSGRDLSASGSGDCERGTDQDDTYLTLTTVEAAVTQRRYATAQRTPRMGPAVWAEVGEGMAASTAAEVMPSARTGAKTHIPAAGAARLPPLRPEDRHPVHRPHLGQAAVRRRAGANRQWIRIRAPRPTGTCSTKAIDHVKIKPRTQPVEQAARHQSDQEDLPRGAEQQHHANASVAEHRNPPRMAVSAGADGLQKVAASPNDRPQPISIDSRSNARTC